MLRIRLMCAATLSAAVLALTVLGMTRTTTAATPTFSKDVAPIIYKNCAGCHRLGDIAPMSLLTYENARPWAKAIREQVATRQMPPWHATQPHGTFLNDRRLSDADRDTLIRWVDGGAPKGDPKDLPPTPKFSDGWEIGTPDVVLSMSKDYEVPDSGTVAYQYFQVPTNFTEDKWVQAIEVRPGTRSVVHHILVFCREPGAKPREMGYVAVVPKMQQRSARADNLIGTTAPGTNAMIFRPGTAIMVKAGSVLVLQMHYTTNGQAAKDRSSVGMIFAKQPPQLEMRTSAFINPMFVIPPGADNHQVDSAIQFTEDSHIWGLIPHTHLRGKSWEYRVVYPDGRIETVLSVPKYDFNWQTYYLFAKPLAVPKGTRLEATAHYDNSTANAFNPNPEAQVRWGDQTWEEMQYTGITYSIDSQRLQPSPEAARKEQK
jgi:Copper type II ascorbate-dependent monooxygenase, C-terminal domain